MRGAKKRRSGGADLYAAGKRPVLLRLSPAEHDLLRRAAQLDGRTMAQLMTHYGLQAVEKILKKNGKARDNTL